MWLNALFNTPVAPPVLRPPGPTASSEMSKIFKRHDPDEKPRPSPLPGMAMIFDDTDVTDRHITAGVYRGDMRCEAGMVALYHNAGTQMLEYEACKGGVAIPYSLHTNPINIGYPDSLGIGAAVLGDGNADFVYEMADTDRKMMKAEGLHIMYGPQVDVATDPRWPRTNGTYGERTDVTSDITEALIKGYQNGDDGLNEGSVVLTVKHFPGDAPPRTASSRMCPSVSGASTAPPARWRNTICPRSSVHSTTRRPPSCPTTPASPPMAAPCPRPTGAR